MTIVRCFDIYHDDVIKWKHFPRNWPFVRKIHRSPVNFPHKGQWRGALMFSLIYVWINDWANNREAGDLRRQHGHYDVIVMSTNAWLRLKQYVMKWMKTTVINIRKVHMRLNSNYIFFCDFEYWTILRYDDRYALIFPQPSRLKYHWVCYGVRQIPHN